MEEKIKKFVSNALDNANKSAYIDLDFLTNKEIRFIRNKTNINLNGYRFSLDTSAVRHIINKHGNKQEKLRAQKPISEDDFLNITLIINNSETINAGITRQNLQSLELETSYINDIKYFCVFEVRTNKKKLVPKTLYGWEY